MTTSTTSPVHTTIPRAASPSGGHIGNRFSSPAVYITEANSKVDDESPDRIIHLHRHAKKGRETPTIRMLWMLLVLPLGCLLRLLRSRHLWHHEMKARGSSAPNFPHFDGKRRYYRHGNPSWNRPVLLRCNVIPFHTAEADDDKITQARCKTLEPQPVF